MHSKLTTIVSENSFNTSTKLVFNKSYKTNDMLSCFLTRDLSFTGISQVECQKSSIMVIKYLLPFIETTTHRPHMSICKS